MKFLKLFLIWAPSRTKTQNLAYYSVLLFVIGLFGNQIIYLLIMRESIMLMSFLQYSVCHVGVIKLLTYQIWRKEWELVIEELAKIEKLFEREENSDVFKQYRSRGRTLIFGYWIVSVTAFISLFFKTCFTTALEFFNDVPITRRTKTYHIWWPFSVEGNIAWIADVLFQFVYNTICTVYVVAWDSLFALAMVVFAGQMQVVTTKFRHGFKSGTLREQKSELILCYQTYVDILK